MRQIILLLGITLSINIQTVIGQVAADCNLAIPICQDVLNFNGQFGTGNNPSEINANQSCLNGENNSIWFKISVVTDGNLNFIITPNVPSEDYNWALYDQTIYSCSDISTGIAPETACNVATDLSAPLPYSTVPTGRTGAFSNSPYFGGIFPLYPSFNGDIPVVAGETYMLYVQDLNSVSGQGFSIDFSSSTASLFDTGVPEIDTAYVFNCGGNTMEIEFNKAVKCASLQATDFSVTLPSGAMVTPTSITSFNCSPTSGSGFTDAVSLTFSSTVFTPGNYIANIVNDIEDACGNITNNYAAGMNIPLPPVDAGADFTFCLGDIISIPIGDPLATTANGIYSWTASPAHWLDSLDNISFANPTLTAHNVQTGTVMFILTVQNFGGVACQSHDTMFVNIEDCCTNFEASITSYMNVGCFGASTGMATATTTGSTGNGLIKYIWNTSPQQITGTATGLSANTNYIVTVTDENQCVDTAQIILSEPPSSLSVNAVGNMVSCFGGSNGAINTTVIGGTMPYTFSWNGGLQNVEDPTGVSAGNYNVTLTDANNCTITESATVTQPATPLVVDASGSMIPCGLTTGNITTNIIGGGAPYIINWNNGLGTIQNPSNVNPGIYEVTVTDAFQCTVTDTALVSLGGSLFATASITDASCNNTSDGAINLTVTGGNQPYIYAWDNGLSPTQNQNNLSIGTYTVTITESPISAGVPVCSFIITNVVGTNSNITLLPTTTDVSCAGAMNGAVQLGVAGGISPYSFNWNNGLANTQNIANLSGGNYAIVVTDGASCQVNTSATVNEPSPIVITPTQTDVTCNGGTNGSILLSVSGGTIGTGTYTYSWSNNLPPTQNQGNLSAGIYTIAVIDANQCAKTTSITIGQPPSINLSTTTTDVTCGSTNNGSIQLTITGGNAPYNFNWDNGVSPIQNPTNLTPGTYTVTVTDANQCTATTSATVAAQGNISLSTTSTDATCSNAQNGSIQLTITGGVAPYSFNWNNGAGTGQNPTSLAAGIYTVTVIDGNQCSNVISDTIAAPPVLNISGAGNQVSCHGGSDGSIQLTVTGGVSPYTFNWSNGLPPVQNPTNVVAGTYFVTVTDANQCTMNSIALINQASELQLTTSVNHPSCMGAANGSINLSVSGGAMPYSFVWNNGAGTVQNPANLNPGTYNVTVTDNNQCTKTTQAILTGITNISTSVTTTDVNCSGGNDGTINLTVSGGATPYLFDWGNANIGNTNTPSNLTTGNYFVTITDANQCTDTASATIGSLTDLVISTNTTLPNCMPNGSISTAITGGTMPYNYAWSANANTGNVPTAINLGGGIYTVTVTDVNGCTKTSNDIVFNATSNLQIEGTVIQPQCVSNSGTIALATLSGATPFTFQWSANAPQLDTNLIQGLSDGAYFITVTDNNGCDTILNYTLNNPTLFEADFTIQAENCGQSNGVIVYDISSGTSPYTFNWSTGDTTNAITGLTAGDYMVTITDGNGCTILNTVTVPGSPGIQIQPVLTNPVCGNDGSIELNITNSNTPLQYTWSNNANTGNTNIANNLGGDMYSVTVTDAFNCTADFDFTLDDSNAPTIVVEELIHNDCFGATGGFIEISVTNTPNTVTYQWSNNATTNQLNNLPSGNYTVTVTDAITNCIITETFTITQPNIIILDLQESIVINSGAQVVLEIPNPQVGVSYSWSGTDGTSVDGPMITVAPSGTTIYTVTASIGDCPSVQATVTVSISELGAVSVPEAFSPNFDGKNDVFRVFTIETKVDILEFRIFNRWGQLIYSNLDGEWDGRHEGKNAPVGSYVYYIIVELIDGSRQELVGDVLLVR